MGLNTKFQLGDVVKIKESCGSYVEDGSPWKIVSISFNMSFDNMGTVVYWLSSLKINSRTICKPEDDLELISYELAATKTRYQKVLLNVLNSEKFFIALVPVNWAKPGMHFKMCMTHQGEEKEKTYKVIKIYPEHYSFEEAKNTNWRVYQP